MIQEKESWVLAAQESELALNQPKIVDVNGARIAIFKIPGESGKMEIYAIEDVCTHDDGPVAEGFLEGCVIECPRHGAKFNIKTGAVECMPAVTPVRTFSVKVENGKVLVRVL